MRLFVASLATETNTFSPVFTDLKDFQNNFYFPPGEHPDVPSLCSAPFIALREYSSRVESKLEVIEGTAAWTE
ncbi:MAG: microcystin LR degradation protein MlrC-like protein, partial [Gammaproteobacteria bacterium]|nr:microcystin LR degradation protein MlrC-like protein [Gammaproteobacteria bacterium]